MGKVYGYVRPLYEGEKLDKQIRRIKKAYPEAEIIEETELEEYSALNNLWLSVTEKITVVFDSVLRIGRESKAIFLGARFDDVGFVFLKEPYLNADVFRKTLKMLVLEKTAFESDAFECVKWVAIHQIEEAFRQLYKEFQQTHERSKSYKPRGGMKGRKLNVKKADPAKKVIREHCKPLGGSWKVDEIMAEAGISRSTYYKYLNEIKAELEEGNV